jgi:diguanylate cyclase (GGDEF)-like protein
MAVVFGHIDAVFSIWTVHSDLMLASTAAIVVETSVVGLLVLHTIALRRKTIELADHEKNLKSIVEHRTAELTEMVDTLETLASTDHLTKIPNRRKVRDEIKSEFTRASRTKREFSLMYLDIDHFKKVNDTHGHKIGDEILVDFAKTITKEVRDIDVVGRDGGEEFLILLPETTLPEAAEIADRIQNAVRASTHVHDIKITCSIGVASNHGLESVGKIIEMADDAMYESKRSGRDTVRVGTPEGVKRCSMCDKGSSCPHNGNMFTISTCPNLT